MDLPPSTSNASSSVTSNSRPTGRTGAAGLNFLSLPPDVIRMILGPKYLAYEDISKNRQVCKLFNEVSGYFLNLGFTEIQRRNAEQTKQLRSRLPRRESERRNHLLYRHCEILSAVETRLALLSMTFGKYIERRECCFIPGKVIDEISRISELVRRKARSEIQPSRTFEVVMELRDISSMAMEHFDEHIVPLLKSKTILRLMQDDPDCESGTNHSPPIAPPTESVLLRCFKRSNEEIQKKLLAFKRSIEFSIETKCSNNLKEMKKDMKALQQENLNLQKTVALQQQSIEELKKLYGNKINIDGIEASENVGAVVRVTRNKRKQSKNSEESSRGRKKPKC